MAVRRSPVASGNLNETAPSRAGLSRRSALKLAGAAGAASALGIVGGRSVTRAMAGNPTKLRLAWTEVAACHSPLAFGLAKGFYSKHDLDVELFYQGASGQTLIQALATNKADAGAGLLLDWLKPLEQGLDVKLFVGSHGGCTRLLASKESGVTTLEGLKGKTIVAYDPASPPKHSFQIALAKSGLDPERDVNWTVAPFDLLGETVKRGQADALVHLDPWAWGLRKQYDLVQVADTQTGLFEGHLCCVLGVNGPFLDANKDAIRRLAEANIEIHEYTGAHPDEVARWYLDNLKPSFSYEDLHEDLASLVWHDHPVGDALKAQVKLGIEELQLISVIDQTTDPTELSGRITANILA